MRHPGTVGAGAEVGLPRYQYTAREVVSGWHYVAYAQECTLAYAKLFAEVILAHLKSCGVQFRGSRVQTDNVLPTKASRAQRQSSPAQVSSRSSSYL